MDSLLEEIIKDEMTFPESIRWSRGGGVQPSSGTGARYDHLDSGGSGQVYLSLDRRFVIKLMLTRKEKVEHEVWMQMKAAQAGLAPDILGTGCSTREHDGVPLCFMRMNFLDNHVDLHDEDTREEYEDQICNYIQELTNLGIVNTTDPRRHFYEVGDGLQMIDFGEFELIRPRELHEKRLEMAAECGVHCTFSRKVRRLNE